MSESGRSERSNAIAPGLLVQFFGPAADPVGEAIQHYTEYRLRNVTRIIERAVAKARPLPQGGMVNLRVAHVLLDDGSYCDDELTASYLGGLLAGSRSGHGRDDRAVAWSKVVTGLSSLQIRAHYLLYREWAGRLRTVGVYELGVDAGRVRATMEVSSAEFVKILADDAEVDENDAMSHSIGGIVRAGLLDDNFFYNGDIVRVLPSIAGIELYGWAQGLPGLAPRSFAAKAQLFDLTDAISRLGSVTFPGLADDAETRPRAGSKQIQVQRQARRSGNRTASDS